MSAKNTLNQATDASAHQIDAAAWDGIYVVGDVHGCRETLERLLEQLEPTDDDLVVFVGDLVRKGPDSKGVIDLVRRQPNFVTVRGNNEQKLIDGRKSIDSLTESDLAYIESMPAIISWDDAMVIHGGIDHSKPLQAHTLTELLNKRSLGPDGGYTRPFWFETRRNLPRIFFGHTVLAEAFVSEYAVGLDTGCVYGGQLTAFDYRTGELIAVDPPETYVSRSADSIVEAKRASSSS